MDEKASVSRMTSSLVLIREQLAEVYTPQGVEVWLNGRNRDLGGERAIDLIRRGESDRVLAMVARLIDGAFS